MKLIFKEKEISIERYMESMPKRSFEESYRITVTVENSAGTVAEIDEMFADFDGNFSIERDGVQESYTGFELIDINRNVDKTSEQKMITFEK